MVKSSTRALDTSFYRAHHGLSRAWRGPLARLHYVLLGRRRALQPHPLFDPHFFVDEAVRRGHTPPDPQEAFDAYLDDPALWSVDPHAYVSFAHEPFASRAPTINPLMNSEEVLAVAAPRGTGHPLLDAGWWLRAYGEHSAGDEPSLGQVLRSVAVQANAARFGSSEVVLQPELDVLFINGEDTCPACTQYRVWNPAMALQRAGMHVSIINSRDLWRWEGVRLAPRVAVVFRATASPLLLQLLQRLKQQRTKLVFDCDDLIFGPEQVHGMMAGRHGVRDREGPNSHIRLMNQILAYMEYGTFPTESLALTAIDFGLEPDRVFVTPTFLSAAQVAGATPPDGEARSISAARLTVASGTWTHHEDLATIAPLVSNVLKGGDAELHLLGSLPPEDFAGLSVDPGQLAHDPRVLRDWSEYVTRYRDYTACLVPLDMDNGFCHAKSEVKYLEAGIARTPIVASATEANRRAITSGKTGWLAVSADEWRSALDEVVGDPELANEIGAAAQQDVLTRYGPEGVLERQYVAVMRALVDGRPLSPASCPVSRLSLTGPLGLPQLTPLMNLAAAMGCTSVVAQRSPRAADIRICRDGTVEELSAITDTDPLLVPAWTTGDVAAIVDAWPDGEGPRVVAAGPDLAFTFPDGWAGAVISALPWADPRTFTPRSDLDHPGRNASVVLLSPPASCVDAAHVRAAREWARHAETLGARVMVVGTRGDQLGLPLRASWLTGDLELELATILRECTFAVRLDPINWTPILTAAVLTGTPIASAAVPEWGQTTRTDASTDLIRGWPTWGVAVTS